MTGGSGLVSIIVANPTVGLDGCRGWAFCFVWRASCKEAPPYHGRQSPPEGVPQSRKGKEAQELPAWHSCPPRDLAVSKEHWAPYSETPLLMASPWDSPSCGQDQHALPRECHYMPAGGCRSIFGQSHGRCQPLCHTC